MSPSYLPTGAAEFPNDNPELHAGARWVCLAPGRPARALLRPSAQNEELPPATADRGALLPPAAPLEPPVECAASRALRFKGPMKLDLGRILLLHRVEDVPPPPDFIFEPFVPSPPRASSSAMPLPIEPLACRIVDRQDAARRVDRGWRVDIAPCVSIGVAASAPAASGAVVSAPAASGVAVSAPPAPAESGRRLARRRGRLAARALSPLPNCDEVSRAISELETAFARAALDSSSDEGAGVSECRANGA